jgi:methylenetetrahydrofolate dehydrogenase (NADP+)/methenyltetrahydrofolate cyclohydrolase
MKIDGRKIAEDIRQEIYAQVQGLSEQPHLTIIQVGENAVSESFLAIKKRTGKQCGIALDIVQFDESLTEEVLMAKIQKAVLEKGEGSVIVQLPLPHHIDTERILNMIPKERDADVLGVDAKKEGNILPPVVGAVDEVLKEAGVALEGKEVLVIGQGRLVGAPLVKWLKGKGITPRIADEHTNDITPLAREADIIISGAGVPHLVQPEMLKEGVVLIDAGTANDNGILKGDIDPRCYEKASFYTAVPGGIGPITVAKLFENVAILASLHIE